MDKPHIFDCKPVVTTLEPGSYAWCSCGLSKKQPFCDGSHAGTAYRPKTFLVEASQNVALCNCKHTNKPPFCDGSHSKLEM